MNISILPHSLIERIVTRLILGGCMKWLTDILTGPDNRSYDNGRVIALASFVVYYILAFWASLRGHPWSPLDFSGGIGAMAIGFGANLHLKRHTEPKPVLTDLPAS